MRCRVQCLSIVESVAITNLARVTWTAVVLAAAPAMAAELPMAGKAPWQPPVLQAYDWTALYVGGHLGYAGGRSNWRSPPISPARSACSSPPIFSTGRAATSGGCKSATTTCCRTASCSAPSSTPRFRAFQISTASPSAASRSSPRRRAAWRAIARRCFTPAPCAVASVTLPATGCSMRPAASPGHTTSWG